jgi:hypothetical protein
MIMVVLHVHRVILLSLSRAPEITYPLAMYMLTEASAKYVFSFVNKI